MNKEEKLKKHHQNVLDKIQKEFEHQCSGRVVFRTEIANDTGENWLRIGGHRFTADHIDKITDEELAEGKTIIPYPYDNYVFWVCE